MAKNPVTDEMVEEAEEVKTDPLHEIRERFKIADEYWSDDRFSKTIAMQKLETATEEDSDAELSPEDAFSFYEEQLCNLGR